MNLPLVPPPPCSSSSSSSSFSFFFSSLSPPRPPPTPPSPPSPPSGRRRCLSGSAGQAMRPSRFLRTPTRSLKHASSPLASEEAGVGISEYEDKEGGGCKGRGGEGGGRGGGGGEGGGGGGGRDMTRGISEELGRPSYPG
eukprot:6726984-Pyramimonas_sp.AAC.1